MLTDPNCVARNPQQLVDLREKLQRAVQCVPAEMRGFKHELARTFAGGKAMTTVFIENGVFHWNPDFLATLDMQAAAQVIAHEYGHFMLQMERSLRMQNLH